MYINNTKHSELAVTGIATDTRHASNASLS